MLVFLILVVVLPVIVVILRRKWQQSVLRSEEVNRLLVSVSEESVRVEFEDRESYYYNYTGAAANASYGSVKVQYQCAVCFCPTTTRCAKCKAVR